MLSAWLAAREREREMRSWSVVLLVYYCYITVAPIVAPVSQLCTPLSLQFTPLYIELMANLVLKAQNCYV